MTLTTGQISDLLAHRDGERLDPAAAAEIEQQSDSRAELTVLRQLKHELNELPAVAPPADAWNNIRARTVQQRPGFAEWTSRFPLATAASVFLAAALAIVVWDPANLYEAANPAPVQFVDIMTPDLSGDPALTTAADFTALVSRSQQLESQLLSGVDSYRGWSPTQRALLYRIADVDSELSRYGAGELTDPASRAQLWQQRVEALESLAQSRRMQADVIPALY
jgi:predicted nucleic acid-binding protein